jgi:uncharacterized protein
VKIGNIEVFPVSLIFKVDQIDEQGIEFSEAFDATWLKDIKEFSREDEVELVEAIKVRGSLAKEGNNLHLRGRVGLRVRTICSRCGDEALWPLEGELELVLVQGAEKMNEPEHEISPEEFNHAYFSGPEIDLSDYFKEQIALEWPMQILCCPDCKGLCPMCGKNLNREKCTCEKEQGDPRLAVLRGLKIDNK